MDLSMKPAFRWAMWFTVLGLVLAWQWRHESMRPSHPPAAAQQQPGPGTAPVLPSAAEPLAAASTARSRSSFTPTLQRKTEELLDLLTQARRAGGPEDLDRIATDLFPALLEQDLAAAVQFVSALFPSPLRERLLPLLLHAWAAKDFPGAIEWIAQLSDPAERKSAFADACAGAAESDAAEAVRSWLAFGLGEDDPLLENLVQRWADHDVRQARAWVLAQPPGPLRERAVERIGYVMAQSEPAEAARFVLRELPEGPQQTEAILSVLHQWALSDPASASAWVRAFPPGPLASRASQELAGAETRSAPGSRETR